MRFADYSATASACARRVTQWFPRALRVLSLTNFVCVDRFVGAWANESAHWRVRREAVDASTQFSPVGVAAQRTAEREAARAGGHVLQDSGTDGLCSCTAQSDGRHFPPLIPWFVVQLAHKVHQALQGGAERLRNAQAESGEYPVDRTYVS